MEGGGDGMEVMLTAHDDGVAVIVQPRSSVPPATVSHRRIEKEEDQTKQKTLTGSSTANGILQEETR